MRSHSHRDPWELSRSSVAWTTVVNASWLYFTQCIQAALLYRSSLALFVVTEAFAYAGFIAFWYKAAASNPNQTFYTPLALVLYFALASFHHGIQHHTSSRDIGSDIRLGKLSYAIIRPFPYLLQALLRSIAFTITYGVLLLPLLVIAVKLVPGLSQELAKGWSIIPWWQYPIAIVIGIMASCLIRIVIGLLAFDMSQVWGPDTLFIALYYSASGVIFPIDLLPATLLAAAQWTPMYYMVGFPVLTLMGRISNTEFNEHASRGLIVLLATSAIVAILWRRGIKRFEAIGI